MIWFVPGTQNQLNLYCKNQPRKDNINNLFWTNGLSYIQGKGDSWMKNEDLQNFLKL